MKLYMGLCWLRSNRNLEASFKQSGAFEMFDTYVKRTRQYLDLEVQRVDFETLKNRSPTDKLWVCERAQNGAVLSSSEDLASRLERAQIQAVKKLWIVIGGADGWTPSELTQMKADFLWSFGPATYPHELASVMMAEQVYRGLSILKGHPYHTGH